MHKAAQGCINNSHILLVNHNFFGFALSFLTQSEETVILA